MPTTTAESVAGTIGLVLTVYLALGALFAVAFVLRGAGRLDPLARTGTWGFRLLVLPGAAAFWPLLLRRWITGDEGPHPPRTPHAVASEDTRR